ncbi:hypothetical protein ACN6K5_001578 [Streptomyces violaceoruber]|uniref:hypothetical protein n=1 Tax=Streptomyces violaceoruber group TaxID=2867121 RepID=UPI003404D9FA
MLHRARPRAALLRHARGDAGSTPIEFLFLATAGIVCAAAVSFVAIRAKAKFDAFVAGRPAPPLLPDFTIPWAAIGLAAGAVALGALITVVVAARRAVSRARQVARRRRATLETRHDRVLEDLGARLVVDLAHHLLDEPELLEALTAAQDARTRDDDHYRAALRTLEAQWKATTADLTATRTA